MTESTNIVCQHCQAVNRISTPRLGDHPVCGKCKNRLFEASPLDLNKKAFDQKFNPQRYPHDRGFLGIVVRSLQGDGARLSSRPRQISNLMLDWSG